MKIYLIALCILVTACGRSSMSKMKEAWNEENNPKLIVGDDLITKLKSLPLSGEANMKGWSDSYWPTYTGGISYRWLTDNYSYDLLPADVSNRTFQGISPAEKYDVALGRFDFPTLSEERVRTEIMKTVPESPEFISDFKIPEWFGLCHGWAPASQNFEDPVNTVTVQAPNNNTVVFYPSDIKALLIYYQQYSGNRSVQTVFAGERCDEEFNKLEERLSKGEITAAELEAAKNSPACRDTNPGTLHLALANEIGRKKVGFVMDRTRDSEVWNQPITSYRSEILEKSDTASEGAAPGTVKEVRVSTTVVYSVETAPSTEPIGVVEDENVYEYWLELDKNGEIIGGRWVSDDRPDFIYRESAPLFQGYFKRLEQIYLKSI